VEGSSAITQEISRKSLAMFEIDDVGLEATDRRILEVIIDKFGGGPVGVAALAAATSEERGTVEEVYEPYLMRLGFIERTSKGRVVTDAGYKHLNLYHLRKNKQPKLME